MIAFNGDNVQINVVKETGTSAKQTKTKHREHSSEWKGGIFERSYEKASTST
jgi:hypothetical protein